MTPLAVWPVLVLAVTLLFQTVLASRALATSARSIDTYDAFRQKYRRTHRRSGADYAVRLALFEARLAEVQAHNALPDKSWVAAINKFADFTDAERWAMLGYRRMGRVHEARQAVSSSFLQVQPQSGRAELESKDWRMQLNASASFMRDQGGCGSCWAVAAVGAVEMHAELEGGPTRRLSFEQLVDCVPNPEHCGGTGGCQGATAELAFQYISEHGLADAGSYKGYMSGGDGTCKHIGEGVRIESFVRLPQNQLQPLLHAVAEKGPAVVSVDANPWYAYDSGVFDGCGRNATVNHAVLLVGYGTDETHGDYWVIRNSWGRSWGENGHIRLQRHDTDQGAEGHCGTDHAPQEGVFCEGGPKEVPVCGMCGVLSDTSYPEKVTISPEAKAI